MEKINIWASIMSGGDGSTYIRWHLTEESAEQEQEDQNESGEGWGESCTECVETFVGSNIHQEAIRNNQE